MNLMQTLEDSLRPVLEEVLAADLAGEITQRVLGEVRPALERALADSLGLPVPRPTPRGRPAAAASRHGRPRKHDAHLQGMRAPGEDVVEPAPTEVDDAPPDAGASREAGAAH